MLDENKNRDVGNAIASLPRKCLDCGIKFNDSSSLSMWFDCSGCGATYVYWKGRWWLEDDANDAGRMFEMQMLGEMKND